MDLYDGHGNIIELSEEVDKLKNDLSNKINSSAVGEKELVFVEGSGYVNYSDGFITQSANAQNTGYVLIDGAVLLEAKAKLSSAGAFVAFYDSEKNYMKNISFAGNGSNKISIDLTEEIYNDATYVIVSNYGASIAHSAKLSGYIATIDSMNRIKETADEAKEIAEHIFVTPQKTSFFEGINYGSPDFVSNEQRIIYNDGIVDNISNCWSIIFACKPNTDYFIYIPGRNRANVGESETGLFENGNTYTILSLSHQIVYNNEYVTKITTGSNAKAIMFYYMSGSYDYEANKNKIIITENEWNPDSYVHIPMSYLPREIANNPVHYDTFSVIGDSYSSFAGYMADEQAGTWYPASAHGNDDMNDVENVEQTWWYKFANEYGSRLIENNSYSGSTIDYDGYGTGTDDGKNISFIGRMNLITSPSLILIYGGTNDSWVASDTSREDFLGEYKYSDFNEQDFIYFRPALAYMIDSMKHRHIGAKIVFMLNGTLSNIKESVYTVCEHYGVSVCELSGITLAHSHPTDSGMTEISKQLTIFLNEGN